MQKPSIGRIVIYTNKSGDSLPAIITGVNHEGDVNLQVFLNHRSGTRLHREVIQGEGNHQWNWPVIQK